MYMTPTRAHPQQYNDPSPPFIDDHRYYNVEGKVKLFTRSGARKNLLNLYYQTPAFGQQPPDHGQSSSSSFRDPKVNFRRSGARKNLLNMYYQTPAFGQQPPLNVSEQWGHLDFCGSPPVFSCSPPTSPPVFSFSGDKCGS